MGGLPRSDDPDPVARYILRRDLCVSVVVGKFLPDLQLVRNGSVAADIRVCWYGSRRFAFVPRHRFSYICFGAISNSIRKLDATQSHSANVSAYRLVLRCHELVSD